MRVELEQDGETLTREETIRVTAGSTTSLAIDFDQDADEAVAQEETSTKLTLSVPADAKVYLAGHLTSTPGEVREFTTTQLAEGAEWSDYTVRVVVERDGQEQTRQETLTLVGGESRELAFDFDGQQVALADR